MRTLRSKLSIADTLILSAVGRDNHLDDLRAKQYHDAAVRLGAHWIISPDDYIYESDRKYPFYQDAHFSRAIRRALALTKLAKGRYGIIGLAIGSCEYQLEQFVATMEGHDVNDFAFPGGDMLKHVRNRRTALLEIKNFFDYLRKLKHRSLLLGVSSPSFLKFLRPDAYSSGGWSIDAAHGRYYTGDGKRRVGMPACTCSVCSSGALRGMELLAAHNLLVDSEQFSEMRRL